MQLRSRKQICLTFDVDQVQWCWNGFDLLTWNWQNIPKQVKSNTNMLFAAIICPMDSIKLKHLLFTRQKNNFDDHSFFQISCRWRTVEEERRAESVSPQNVILDVSWIAKCNDSAVCFAGCHPRAEPPVDGGLYHSGATTITPMPSGTKH